MKANSGAARATGWEVGGERDRYEAWVGGRGHLTKPSAPSTCLPPPCVGPLIGSLPVSHLCGRLCVLTPLICSLHVSFRWGPSALTDEMCFAFIWLAPMEDTWQLFGCLDANGR